MSDLTLPDRPETTHDGMIQAVEARGNPLNTGAMSFLLEPDPEAAVSTELVDQSVELPQDQFEALLIDSECEV
jgi:hypothetical protein